MEQYVITISRQFASMGRTIAQKLSEELDIEFYDRDIVEATAKRMGLPVSYISSQEEHEGPKFFRRMYPLGMGLANVQDEIYSVQTNIISDFIKKDSCIIVGRSTVEAIQDQSRALNIYIYAPYEARLKNCVEVLKMEEKNAKKMIKEVDRAREMYRQHYSMRYSGHGHLSPYDGYDLMIDSSKFGVDGAVELITELVKKKFG